MLGGAIDVVQPMPQRNALNFSRGSPGNFAHYRPAFGRHVHFALQRLQRRTAFMKQMPSDIRRGPNRFQLRSIQKSNEDNGRSR